MNLNVRLDELYIRMASDAGKQEVQHVEDQTRVPLSPLQKQCMWLRAFNKDVFAGRTTVLSSAMGFGIPNP